MSKPDVETLQFVLYILLGAIAIGIFHYYPLLAYCIAAIIVFLWINKLTNQNQAKGDDYMLSKYSEVIEEILKAHPDCKIRKKRPTYIEIGVDNYGGRTIFSLFEPDVLIMLWEIENKTFGKHRLRWEFKQGTSQTAILEKVNTDIKDYTLQKFQQYAHTN